MNTFRRLTLALIAGILAVCCLAVPAAQATSPSQTLGVYAGGGNVQGANSFANWVGHPVGRALDFVDGSSWSSIESPTWYDDQWGGTGYQMDFSIPMFPDSGGSLATGASGGYNSHWVKLAQNFVAHNQATAVIRPGWEFNGSWFSWSAMSNPGSYAAYFRQIVTSMRSVPGQNFKFEWNPSLGVASGLAPDRAYPGDQYVDYVGEDIYDQSWISNYHDPVARWNDFMNQPYGLKWQRDFAAQHGKAMTFPEWGLAIRDDGHGGGDNPYFITQMYTWMQANNVTANYYFGFDAPDGQHKLTNGRFPQAADQFKQLFGTCRRSGRKRTRCKARMRKARAAARKMSLRRRAA